MQYFSLCVPFLGSLKDTMSLCLTCKYLQQEEDSLFHFHLLAIREQVDEYFLDLFLNHRMFDYEYPQVYKQVVNFLNYKTHTEALKYSWKTCALLVDLNIDFQPVETSKRTYYRVSNSNIGMLQHLSKIRAQLHLVDKRVTKNNSTFTLQQKRLSNALSDYTLKVNHVNVLSNQIPPLLNIMQRQISQKNMLKLNMQKNETKKLCTKLTGKFGVIRTMLNQIDSQVRFLCQKQNVLDSAKKEKMFLQQLIQRLEKSFLLYVYNVNKDILKQNVAVC